ncbi:MAG: transposase zinc-binding domain-containing protein, partial [Terriglobales bacterium]
MKYRDPLKQILSKTSSHWDCDETRPSARRAFRKVMQCRTPALGVEVYASENEERLVNHTCKSPACSSCGNKTTIDWRRDREAAMPDGLYKGITFTMPDLLWSFFRDNRFLVPALS